MTTPKPNHEWRHNSRLTNVFPHIDYYDLFVDDEYQHMWVTYDRRTGKYGLHTYDKSVGEFDSIAEAIDHIVALDVVERFEKAYGRSIGL